MGRFIPNENSCIRFAIKGPGSVGAPTITLSTATTGGTLAPGAYSYRVVSKNAAGHGLPSLEVSVTVPSGTSTNANTVDWAAVTGATAGYDIYGRSAGVEQLIGSVATGTHTFLDTGSATPAGKLPTKDTSISLDSPTVSDIDGAVDLTDLTMSFNASDSGNAVPTPSFSRLFETSIVGTSQATFTADFYRDDEDDLAWDALPKLTRGWWYVSRYGGVPDSVGDVLEVWPTVVISRTMANMANNTVESFTVTCSLPAEPVQDAVVVAG